MTEQGSSMTTKLYDNMRQKSTEELLQIWTENDRTEWSDEAYAAIRQVLTERNVSLPAQAAVVVEEEEEGDANSDALVRLSTWAQLFAWLSLVVTAGISGINVVSIITSSGGSFGIAQIFNILSALLILMVGLFLFVFLMLIGKGIFVMLDILDNTNEIASQLRKRA